MIFEYFVNLDERGEFFADIRNEHGSTVFEIHGHDIFEDGFMRHTADVDGLHTHLVNLKLMGQEDKLFYGN